MGSRTVLVLIAVVAASMVLGTGCRNRSRSGRPGGGGTDSGMIAVDGGGGGDTDSGGIVLMDSGPPPPRDSGGPTPECTSDSDCLSSEMCSSGFCVPRSTMTCTSSPVPRFSGVPCSSSTLDCISGCADGACQSACLMADPNPDCGTCFSQNLVYCYNNNGCQSDWNCYSQCASTSCPSGDETCLDSMCGSEWDAYITCTEGVTADCSPDALACFPS